MAYEIQKGTLSETGKGTGWVVLYAPKGDQGEPRKSATIHCPKCACEGSLRNHEIAADGTVTPSCVCPYSPCDFHEMVKLVGWDPALTEEDRKHIEGAR